MGEDRRHMKRALALAEQGMGSTAPNPMVGCVLVKDGEVIAEGWHRAAGAPHAEAEALTLAGDHAHGATAYVTLEPCNHHGRTPPCAAALAKAGVAEVVYAMADPHDAAAGGAEYLRSQGVKVRAGVCEEAARRLNRFWIHAVETGRPYVIAKFAMSLDGKIATSRGDSKWITGPEARERAHQLRRQVDAIIVGAGTVIADDPSLTARDGIHIVGRPLRVILDTHGKTPPASAVYDRAGRGAFLAAAKTATPSRLDAYRRLGVDVVTLDADASGRPDVADLITALVERGANAVMVEGGAETLGSFFDAGLVDEVWAFIAPIIIGGGKPAVGGQGAPLIANALKLTDIQTEHLGADMLVRGRAIRRETA